LGWVIWAQPLVPEECDDTGRIHVDNVDRSRLSGFAQTSVMRFRYGVVAAQTFGGKFVGMARGYSSARFAIQRRSDFVKVIEFYVPTNFHTPLKTASLRCGKVIEFCTPIKKSA
jgi:hypothetical protein